MEVVHLNHNQISENPHQHWVNGQLKNQSKWLWFGCWGIKNQTQVLFQNKNSNVLILRVWIYRETGGSCLLCTVNLDLVPWMLKTIKYWLGLLRLSSID